ncbi:MAG: M23 family metallopeptidase [Deltaproteobacteria bacterium]|nr:M23 family metallopeptidase [Deltaproteobacteria bacterium]
MGRFLQIQLVLLLILWTAGLSHGTGSLRVECIPNVARQGGVCLTRVWTGRAVESVYGIFEGEEFPMARVVRQGCFEGLLGIDMREAPGPHELEIIALDENRNTLKSFFPLNVEQVTFGVQRLSLPRSKVDLSPETLKRVRREAERVKSVLKRFRDERLWWGVFVRPVEGQVTSGFGLRRILNGEERSPHTGVDLRAPEGTPVRATNRGLAVLVDELFFSGRMVILDHGWGMFSMYSHLSKALVHEGEMVSKGQVIGLAGSTGRVTGPHLDWRVRLNGARVDPLSLVGLSEYLGE